MTSREQFEAWFPSMVVGIPESMVKVFDEMLFMAWQASGKRLKLKFQKDITSAITMVLLLMYLMLFMRFSMLD